MVYLTTAGGNLIFDPVGKYVSTMLMNIWMNLTFELLLHLGIWGVGLEGNL